MARLPGIRTSGNISSSVIDGKNLAPGPEIPSDSQDRWRFLRGHLTGVLDLVQGGSQSVARFAVPPGARDVRVVVRLDDYGAYESKDGTSGAIDARGKVLTLALDADHLASGPVVVSLDADRSLTTNAKGAVLEPSFGVSY